MLLHITVDRQLIMELFLCNLMGWKVLIERESIFVVGEIDLFKI